MTTDRRRRWSAPLGRSLERAGVWRAARRSRRPDFGPLDVDVLSEVLEDAPFGFAVLDEHGRYRLVNRRLAVVNGVAAGDHVGLRPDELPRNSAIDDACVEEVLRTGIGGRSTRATLPDPTSGVERFLATSCYPVRDSSGRVSAVGAVAIDVTDQEHARRSAEQLLRFAGLVGAVTSSAALAQRIVEFVSSTFRARCAVGEARGDHLRIIAIQGFTTQVCRRWMHDGFTLSESRPITAAIRQGSPVVVSSFADASRGDGALEAERVETGDSSVIAIPLRDVAGESGPKWVVRISWPHPWVLDHGGWTTLHTLASMAELALSRILLNDRQQAAFIDARVAEEADAWMERRRIAIELLQRAALPAQLPSILGVSMEAVYRPAMTAGVGGDWYDAFALANGRVGLVIADVAGHGEEAASFMVQVRNALRAMAIEHEHPHVVLERLNAVSLSLRDDNAPFITCCYAVLDPLRRKLAWSTAGHFDPLVVGAEDGARYISAPHRPPLTVSRDPNYVTSTVKLDTGDRIVMFTDGLIERRGETIDRGLTRLAQHARQLRREKLVDCVEALLEIVDEQLDDLAVICAELVSTDQ